MQGRRPANEAFANLRRSEIGRLWSLSCLVVEPVLVVVVGGVVMGHTKGSRKRRRVEKQAAETSKDGDEPCDWWLHFSRRLTGPLALSKESGRFESIFKISRKTFNYICSLVGDYLMAKPHKLPLQ
ncbi:hypothetical protein J5N97_030102 [Dioscorea zingiberensis]|uniref:Uncharacterized protein n=1 Tax=Dioscorea zingiberensis TaxID=325984 RepID=A0A9D5BX13_9LILI|nr:hypothetical protein J5N97_030102 [Dioscorea zingiberensis]